MAGHVHRVMQNAQYVDAVFGAIQDVEDEMPGGPATLRDVEQAPVRGQAFAMVAKFGMLAKPLASLGEQGAVLRHLQRSELRARRAEYLLYVRFRDVA